MHIAQDYLHTDSIKSTDVVPSISFQTILYRHLKLSKTLENSVCYCYTSYEMTDQFFMISASNKQLQQQLEYTLLKPDYHSWWILKIQSGREDTLEERYAIKLCFKLGKNATEAYGMLQTAFQPSCMNRVSVFECHKRFKEGTESVRDDERCERSWLAKGLGLGLLCWGFKGVQAETPWVQASTLEIGSVAFPPGRCTSPQLHPCHRLFDQDGHQDSSSAFL